MSRGKQDYVAVGVYPSVTGSFQSSYASRSVMHIGTFAACKRFAKSEINFLETEEPCSDPFRVLVFKLTDPLFVAEFRGPTDEEKYDC